jgi:hypothetical protein
MQRLGFPPRWRDWITLLFATANTSVLLNGVAGRPFKHRRGLRQGNPLSPLLFDLAIDPLQLLIQQATTNGILNPLPVREASLRLSLYADDAVIFANPHREELDVLLDIVDGFGNASGLRINVAKCTISPIRCSDIDLEPVLSGFNGQVTQFPVTYLGLPLTLGRLRLANLQPLLDRSRAKLAAWKGKLLNAGGRRALTRSVLDALTTYALTALTLPKKFTLAFDQVRRHFTWDIDETGTAGGKCKVNWPTICSPTTFSGLGILDLDRFARALRLRWLWLQWHHPECPWTQLGTPCSALDHCLFAAATRVTVGNEARTSFWWSNWRGGETLRCRFPLLYKHSIRKHRSVAQALTDYRWVLDL